MAGAWRRPPTLPWIGALLLSGGVLAGASSSWAASRDALAGLRADGATLPVLAPETAPPGGVPVQGPRRLSGVTASPRVIQELGTALALAIRRFEAKDAAGVLEYVSDQYRTGPMTKALLRGQLLAMFQIYDAVRARVRIDEVRMVEDQAWVFSTGEVSGLLPWLNSWMTLLEWEREPEVVRKERGRWRLFGLQQ